MPGRKRGGLCSVTGSRHLFGLFLFNMRKVEQTRGFSVEPVKLVLGSLGLFSCVLFGKLAIQSWGCVR